MTAQTQIHYSGEINNHTGMALGGLGTGTLAIDHAGRFQDICVQNNWRTKRQVSPAGSFFAIHTESPQKSSGKVLQLTQEGSLPCIDKLDYCGDFPFLNIDYTDKELPCDVSMEAFSPMVPHHADISSLPLVFFKFKVKNTSKTAIKAAIAFSWQNDISVWMHHKNAPLGPLLASNGKYNTLLENDDNPAVLMSTYEELLKNSEYMLTGIKTDGVKFSAVADWWNIPLKCNDFMNDNPEIVKLRNTTDKALALWRSFLERGELPAERNFDDKLGKYSYHSPAGAVAGEIELAPAETKEICFALLWYFPYHLDGTGHYIGHEYARRFPDGTQQIASKAIPDYEALRSKTGSWKPMIANASLPEKTLKFINSSLYLLPRITWYMENGNFTYYESLDCPRMFCIVLEQCAAPLMAAFFPELHAKALELFVSLQRESGEIPTTLGFFESIYTPEFRVFSPNDVAAFPLSVYTNIVFGADTAFAKKMYPKVKRAMQWGKSLDVDNDGIPDCHGFDQGWDTWPMSGTVSYLSDLWLAALKAGIKMAKSFKDEEFANWCSDAFKKASDTIETKLWNGKYYNLFYNRTNGTSSDTSAIDQFAGQTWANILGLGDLHPRERIKTAVKNILKNNIESAGKYPCSGVKDGGIPDCSSTHNKQSRAFVPCFIGSFSANAMCYGEFEKAVNAMEQAADAIINKEEEPWLGQLLFDSADGKHFYGVHYLDMLIIWDVMHALAGAKVDPFNETLTLCPCEIPSRGPVFSNLFWGEVEYKENKIILHNHSDIKAEFKRIIFRHPQETEDAETFENVVINPKSFLCLDIRLSN